MSVTTRTTRPPDALSRRAALWRLLAAPAALVGVRIAPARVTPTLKLFRGMTLAELARPCMLRIEFATLLEDVMRKALQATARR